MKSLQALLALFACAALPLHAAGLDDLTWTTTDDEVTITFCNRAATGELVIPGTIEGNPVASIGDYAFRNCTSLTSITTPIASPASERLPSTPAPARERKFLALNNLPSIQSPSPS
jgi:hypothetical protein